MRLALRLGFADVDAMLGSLTSKQIEEWRQYDMIEPINGTDQVLAKLSSMFHAAHAGKGGKTLTAADFMPMLIEDQKPPQTPEQQRAIMRMAFKSLKKPKAKHGDNRKSRSSTDR